MRRQVDRELWTGGVLLAIGVGALLSFIPFVAFAIALRVGAAIERARLETSRAQVRSRFLGKCSADALVWWRGP